MRGYISIGSNIDKQHHISAGLQALEKYFGALLISSIYESTAVGFVGDSFYNAVVGFDSDLTVTAVAQQLRQIELDNGRRLDSQKFSSRTLDLDLILYGDCIIDDGQLQIPRHDIERYAFVLEPLAEIAPDAIHPMTGISYGKLWQQFDKTHSQQHKLDSII